MKKPILIEGVNVTIRDTILLMPGGGKSLASLGSLWGENKIKIGDWIKRME